MSINQLFGWTCRLIYLPREVHVGIMMIGGRFCAVAVAVAFCVTMEQDSSRVYFLLSVRYIR